MFKGKKVQSDKPIQQKPLRLWPGLVAVILMWILRYGIPLFFTGDTVIMIGVFGELLCALTFVLWWAFFSRAPRFERWSAILLMIVALLATSPFIHVSIATTMQGLMFSVYSIPVLCLAFVVWAIANRRPSGKYRRTSMILTILLASGFWVFLRTDGMTGEAHQDFAWRWAKTAEERLLAQQGEDVISFVVKEDTAAIPEWPGFRGPNRDGKVHGVQIETDWSVSPPKEMWRQAVGPGCSSFSVNGELFYTQEQRGEYEAVSCYDINTGKAVWRHKDSARFWDSHAGAGPRGTPTISSGRIYSLGATGILNVLDAYDGSVIWSRNAVTDIDAKVPGWGIASSPLVVDDIVIVAITGKLVAYDINTGEARWFGTDGGGDTYSSAHLFTINGITQVLLMSGAGATSFNPDDGTQFWEHKWQNEGRTIQPAITPDGDLLISGCGKGMRRIKFSHKSGEWTIEEAWTSLPLRPTFNDFVIHKGHAYGYNGRSIVCVEIENGKMKWKKGRYGGQLLLLADQDLLLILSEKGDLALVKAEPEQFTELAFFPAIKGKTWNHPVMVNDILLVRNTSEMAAFRLSSSNKL